MSSVGAPSVYAFPVNITFQPGSTPAAPVTTPINLGDIYCYSVEVEVLSGPGGLMGFYLSYASTPILPWGQTPTFLTVDNYQHTFPINAELGGSLACVGYNLGDWPHTAFLRFLGIPVAAYSANAPIAPVAELDLSGLG